MVVDALGIAGVVDAPVALEGGAGSRAAQVDVPVVVAEIGPGDEERVALRRDVRRPFVVELGGGRRRRAAVDAHVAAHARAAVAAAADVDVLERQPAGRAIALVDPGDERVAGVIERQRRVPLAGIVGAGVDAQVGAELPSGCVEARQLDAAAVVDAPVAEFLPDDEDLAAVAAHGDVGPQLDDRSGRVVADALRGEASAPPSRLTPR